MGEKLRMKEKKLIHQEEIQTEEMEIKQRLLEKTQIEKIIRQHLENPEEIIQIPELIEIKQGQLARGIHQDKWISLQIM